MRWSEALIPTLKETPAEAESASHRLMLRAGLIRKLAAGIYSYLPLGFRVLKKVEEIVREEMDNAGAQEFLLPAIHPADLWHKTGRYDVLGDEMIKYKDRTGKEMVLGPTHEEVITDIAKNEIRSYRDIPQTWYQIQTKFRDEPRPRFGVIRSKEFIMKDAYSFDADEEGLDKSYKKMYDAYCKIFSRCGLEYVVVEADPGFMGGKESAEFMVLAEAGEDLLAICGCGYAASLGVAECIKGKNAAAKKKAENMKEVDTPGITTVEKVSKLLKAKPSQLIKTLIYLADNEPVAILIRGDHDANEAKIARALGTANIKLADEQTIEKVTGAPVGFSGPYGLKGLKVLADYAVESVQEGITGANKKDKHLINVKLNRDYKVDKFFDLRYIKEGDVCPKCKKKIKIKRAIELGHVFKLGTKYTDALDAKFSDEKGNLKPIIMGCYGIGINRIIAAVIEKSSDEKGIIWPKSIAPYDVIILPLASDKKIKDTAEKIYSELQKRNINCLLDDREQTAGVKFKDADLIGIPTQIVIGPKNIAKDMVEIKLRKDYSSAKVKIKEAITKIKSLL